jgi:hypothetical protein
VFSSDREVHETEKFLAVGAGRRRFCSGTWQVDTTVVELDLLSIYLYVSFSTFPFLLRVCRSTAMCTAPLLRDILFYRLCYRSSHSLCLSVEAAIRLHINFRLVRLHCTGSVETPGFTLKSPFRFSFFFVFLLAEVQRKIFFKNFSFGGKEGLVTLGFSPNIPLQESLVAYKIPSFASAKTSARATPSRIFHLIRRIFTHFFSLLNLPCHVPLRTVSFE